MNSCDEEGDSDGEENDTDGEEDSSDGQEHAFDSVVSLSPSQASYCHPSQEEGAILLESLFEAPYKLAHSEYGSTKLNNKHAETLHTNVANILSSNSERVTDIAEWLSEQGYYIPSEQDIEELQMAKDTAARIEILNRLNLESDRVEGKIV
jgi:hypothetical protein